MAYPERLERRMRALARIGELAVPRGALGAAAQVGLRAAPERGVRRSRRAADARDARAGAADRRAARAAGGCGRRRRCGSTVPYAACWNLTGQPACSVPAGHGSDGLPRAVQLVGRHEDEATLVSLAAQIESARPWARCAPAGLLVSDEEELLALASEAARAAGALLLGRAAQGPEQQVAAKSTPTDPVSEADHASERAIRELLDSRRPDDGFIGEEGGAERPGASGLSVGRRPARRDGELRLRDPAVVRERRGARSRGHDARRRGL